MKAAGLVLLAVSVSPHSILAAAQRTFDTPDAAASALLAATKSRNADEMAAVLGEEMRDQFQTGDPVRGDLDRALFMQAAQDSMKLQSDGSPDRVILYVGEDDWPFPAPIVKAGGIWQFNGKEGKQEILDRRIGRNEMHAVETALGYVDAQLEYLKTDHDGDGILEFAQKLLSTPGMHDGLYWKDDSNPSPLGPLFVAGAKASPTVPAQTRSRPHFGYQFRILTAQGANAIGGTHEFLIAGHLLGGFGLIASPLRYGITGIQTYVVNQLGVVYSKDLGADTATAAAAITAFDPDLTWKKLQ
jgi:hypothetical protein